MQKYELTTESKINWMGRTLFRIRACCDFTTVTGEEIHKGDLGGYVEKESNLAQAGKAWVHGDAEVYGDARVFGDAEVYGDARVFGNARVYGDAKVCGDTWVYGNAWVCGDAWVHGDAEVYGNAKVYGDAKVCGDARVYGDARVCGDAEVYGNAKVYGDAKVCGDAWVYGDASIFSSKHILCITPIGDYANSMTAFRTKQLVIKISFEGGLYTINEFNEIINGWDDVKNQDVARAAIELAKLHIDLTPEDNKSLEENN